MKLPDELVERAAKAVHVVRHPGLPYDPICSVCILEASRALEAALSEGGTTMWWCSNHKNINTGFPNPANGRYYCRGVYDEGGSCNEVESLVIPLESKE